MRRINIKLVFIYVVAFILLFNINNVYSRYVSSGEDTVSLNVSSWDILVNNNDITSQNSSNINIQPVILSNANIKDNTFAPGSNGYFDVLIDCSNVTMSFSYTIDVSMLDTTGVSNVGITGYSIITSGSGSTTPSTVSLNKATSITDTKIWSSASNFQFAPFTVRVYFGWLAVDNATINSEDSSLASSATNTNTIRLNVGINFKQYVQTQISFATSSWSDIVSAYSQGNTTQLQQDMENGVTRSVDLGTLGTHQLRIANLSTPADCSTSGFSQTACGFVVEFADMITEHRMNPIDNNGNIGTGSVGGWNNSEMRTYVNSDIYNALPNELRSKIINTSVVSGHGSNDSNNFTSTDKLYLLDVKEIYGTSFTSQSNTAKDYERQLDYYSHIGITTSSYAGAIKLISGTDYVWWLRSAYSNNGSDFFVVSSGGDWYYDYSHYTLGVSPAFRIG